MPLDGRNSWFKKRYGNKKFILSYCDKVQKRVHMYRILARMKGGGCGVL